MVVSFVFLDLIDLFPLSILESEKKIRPDSVYWHVNIQDLLLKFDRIICNITETNRPKTVMLLEC
jgi:hypothetical protein